MSDTRVISLADRRSSYNGAQCPCGSAWFVLRRTTTEGHDVPGAVCLDQDGRISGYTGYPHCSECGTPLGGQN
ncbi:hypothetical protein [Nocardiopsis synnemataformans]|uniref:hypothetical protein n=1 Tax=Nocardiopsis synnemataformans TaxID=61305 RepID=UPI003EB78A3F